jgi:hypothetical protein
MRVVLAAMMVVVVASCGTPAGPNGEADGGASQTPGIATTLATPPDATATFPTASTLVAPGRSPSPVDPAEACPRAEPSGIFADEEEMMEGSAMAERNIGVINRYVAANPEVATHPYLDGSAEPPRVVVGFTGDLAPHQEVLRPQLADPDRVLICQVPFSGGQLQAIAKEIQRSMAPGGPVVGVGAGASAVNVTVTADGEAFAAGLVETYGAAIDVQVGLFPYPMPAELAASMEVVDACASDLAGPTDMNGLVAELRLDSGTLVAGDGTEGRVVFTNTGTGDVSFETGDPLVGSVVRPGTNEIVATYSGDIAGVGAGGVLAPGETLEVGLLVGTASCIPANGYVLPPGEYEVIARAVVDYSQNPATTQLVSRRAALTVEAR